MIKKKKSATNDSDQGSDGFEPEKKVVKKKSTISNEDLDMKKVKKESNANSMEKVTNAIKPIKVAKAPAAKPKSKQRKVSSESEEISMDMEMDDSMVVSPKKKSKVINFNQANAPKKTAIQPKIDFKKAESKPKQLKQKAIEVPGLKLASKSKAINIDSDDTMDEISSNFKPTTISIAPKKEQSRPAKRAKKISYSLSEESEAQETEASFNASMNDEESDFE